MEHLTPYVTDTGKYYGIPKDSEEEFKADFGERAKPVHAYRTPSGKTYAISDERAKEFAHDFPDAEPVRRLKFADGKTRDFTTGELRSFLAGNGEFHTSDEFKADREEVDEKVREKAPAAFPKKDDAPATFAADVPVIPMANTDEEQSELGDMTESSVKGAEYMGRKIASGYVKAFLTGSMRMMGRALNTGLPMNPSVVGGTASQFQSAPGGGDPWIDAANAIDEAVAPSKEDEQFAADNGLSVPGKVEEVAHGIGAFALAMHNLGPAVGGTLMSAQAGNDTYLSLYDMGIQNGLSPEKADAYANAGGAIALLGTAAMCKMPITKLLRITGAPTIDMGKVGGVVGNGAITTYSDLLKAATVGNMKNYILNAGLAAGESALIMGGQTYGVTLAAEAEKGNDVGSWETQSAALWEAGKAAVEGGGIGLFMGGMNYLDYRKAVRLGVESEAHHAAFSKEGRDAWRTFFPQGVEEMMVKRMAGKDISRSDINKAGFPEMTAKERNEVADLFIKDAAEAQRAREAQAPRELPAPTDGIPPDAPVENGEPKPPTAPVPVEPPKEPPKLPEPKPEVPAPEAPKEPTAPVLPPPEPTAKALDAKQSVTPLLTDEEAKENIRLYDNFIIADHKGQKAFAEEMERSGDSDKAMETYWNAVGEARDALLAFEESHNVHFSPIEGFKRRNGEPKPSDGEPEEPVETGDDFGDDLPPPDIEDGEAPVEPTKPTAPAKETPKPTGDVAKDLAAMSDDDLDALINDALAEKESATPAEPQKPPTKLVNKGKGPVPVLPNETGNAPAASAPAPSKAERRRAAERAKVSEGLSGAAADAMGDLFDLFGASDSVKNSLGMAAKPVAGFDENLYNTRVRKGFDALLADCQQRGGGVKEFVNMVVSRLGGAARPYIHRFAADLKKGTTANGPEGATSNRDGVVGGRDEAAGRGDAATGSPAPVTQDNGGGAANGSPEPQPNLPVGVPNGQGGGGRDGIRPDGPVAGHEADNGGVRPPSDTVGNGLATADAGTGDVSGSAPVVFAPNGNLDTRKSPPVRLTATQRAQVNERVKELIKKPVGSLTPAEKDVLRQFTGAGGLGFKGRDAGEQRAALTQFFTDASITDAMWNALEKAGVPMKNVCEPAAGSGNFPGRRPELNWTLCELDPTASGVLKHLFPAAKHLTGTFEDVKLPEQQDLFISNVPFLEVRNHKNRPDIKTLHDFFFVHSLNQTKPNGVVAFVTSTGTMDKLDPTVRQELIESGDVIGAYRLPSGMFKSAGTDATTDVIFIQKRPENAVPSKEQLDLNEAFASTVDYPGGGKINGYYAMRPENILGSVSVGTDRFGKMAVSVGKSDATDLSQIAVNYSPYATLPETDGKKPDVPPPTTAKKYPHSVSELEKAGVKYALNDGDPLYSQNIRLFDGVPYVKADEFTLDGYEEGTHMAKVFERVEGETAQKIAALQQIVDDAAAFQRGDADAQKRGIDGIADYKRRFGVHPGKDKALRKFFKDAEEEVYFRELGATFDEDFSPAAVFREKVRHGGSGKKKAGGDASLIDQALASEDGNGEIRLGDKRCQIAEGDIGDLLQSGYSISSADGGKPVLQNNVIFESGNIYKKIAAQKAMKDALPAYAAQIDAQVARLESLIPTPKVFDAIPFKGIEGWNDDHDHGWVAPILAEAGISIHGEVEEDSNTRTYVVTAGSLLNEDECKIVSNYLSGKRLVKKDKDESDTSYATRARQAEATLSDIYAKIRNRVGKFPELVEKLERGYNERFNAFVAPDYTKAEYLIKDTVKAFADAGVNLRANQRKWVTQALIEGVGINAHDVGGGKTLAAMALAHALKARGVCQKPMFVVPAKTIKTSWLNSSNGMQKLFPKAKIVNLGSLPSDKRTKMLFDVANSNADAIFISHEGFEAIQLPPGDEIAMIQDYAWDLIDVNGKRGDAVQQERIAGYIEQLKKEKRDTRLTLDKLGVDCIIVDEAHAFKNVGVSSSLDTKKLGKGFSAKVNKETGRVTLDPARALDFRFKADYISGHNNGRNVFLLTATPTPNKPIELYTMLRHLGRGVLADYGINTDRAFAAKFFNTALRNVQSTSGGTKPGTILTELRDCYALNALMRRFIDRIPMTEFAKQGIPLPNARVETRFVDQSSDMEAITREIQQRVADASHRGFEAPKKGEDTVIAAFTNGRNAAVTPYAYSGSHAKRRVFDRTHDPATDKIEYAVQEAVHEINLGNKEGKPRTVIIFSDVQGGSDGVPSIPEDIKQTLIGRGLDPKEVAIVTGSTITNPKTGHEIQASGKNAQELKGEIQDLFAPKGADGKPPADPQIKVIIGSTASIGEGLNLNTWTSLEVNLDVPLTPGAIQQRKGRMVRFGNQHQDTRIVNLFTRGSFDMLSYDIASRKVGWNQAIWDPAHLQDTINVEAEMAAGAGIDPQRIIIECIKDPVEKIRRTLEYKLANMQTELDSAREAVFAVDGRIATQRRNIEAHKAKMGSHATNVQQLKNEAATLEASVPDLEKKRDAALADVKEHAATNGDANTDKIDALVRSCEGLVKAADALNKASGELDSKNEATVTALDEAKKANGAAKEAVADAVKSFADKDGVELAKIYSNFVQKIIAAKRDASKSLLSIPWHEEVIKTSKRDIAAAENRIAELNAERDKAEAVVSDLQKEMDALGSEWYDGFGTKEQKFKLEKASAQAEMDAANEKDDEEVSWMRERQTIEAMAAGGGSGASGAGGRTKLPSADSFSVRGTGTAGKPPISRSEVFAFARELFPELRITSKGTYHRRGVLGWLEVENRVIRTVDPLSIPTLAHELGHAVIRLTDTNLKKMPKDAKREFVDLGVDLYGDKTPAGGFSSEGVAEFVRGFLCDYDLAKDYPAAHKWFFEDFGAKHPDFIERLFALKGKILNYTGMTPEQKIRGMWDHKIPVAPSEIPFWRRAMRYDWKTKWVDSNFPILRVMRESGADALYNFHNPSLTPGEKSALILNHPYHLATLFQGKALRFAETDALDATVDLYGEKTGDSLQQIIEPIARMGKERLKEFWDFAVAMRGADYAKRGMEFGATRGEIAATIAKYRSPEFKAALQGVTDWSHRVLHLLVDAGALTPQEYEQICEANPVYVPIHRVFAEQEIDARRKRAGKRGVFHRKGGSQDIDAPATALVEMASRVRQAAMQAKVVQSLVEVYDRLDRVNAPNKNRFMVEMPNPIKRTAVWADRVKDQIAKMAIARFDADPDAVREAMAETWTEELFCFSQTKYKGSQRNIVTIRDGAGKLRTFEVVDKGIVDILTSYVEPEQVTTLGRVGQLLTNGVRMGATVLNASFSVVANPIRDTMSGALFNEYGAFVPGLSSIDGMINQILRTDLSKAYARMGGDMGAWFQDGAHMAAKKIADAAQTANPFLREAKKGVFTLVGNLLSIPEVGPRLAAFRGARNYWLSQGVGEKAANLIGRLCGGDITIDFGRAGSSARKANRYLAFFNAAVRGIEQLSRSLGFSRGLPWQNPGKIDWGKVNEKDDLNEKDAEFQRQARARRDLRTLVRGIGGLTSFALLGYLYNMADDERRRKFEELKPQYKWNNVMFGDVRIPAPFEPGLLFMSLPVSVLESVRRGDARDVKECLREMARQFPLELDGLHGILRNFTPIAPEIDVIANEKWNGSPVVPERMKRLDPADWVDENTTAIAKVVGQTLCAAIPDSMSGLRKMFAPKIIDFLADQHTGGMYSKLCNAFEAAFHGKAKAIGVDGDWSKLPVLGRLMLNPFASSRLTGDFYDELDNLAQKHASGRLDAASLGRYKTMDDVQTKVIRELSSARREVLSSDMDAREQKVLIDEYTKRINDIIRNFNEVSKTADWRPRGIEAAAVALSEKEPAKTTEASYRKALDGVDAQTALNAIRAYGRRKGWSKDTVNKRILNFMNNR